MAPIISNSISYYEVLRKLGLRATGSANTRIREIVRKLNLDTSHFLGKTANSGKNWVGNKVSWEEILVRDRFGDGRKEDIRRLRRALTESGVEEKCEECDLTPFWNGKPLRLQIDHRNGDCIDNNPGNPRFLCPNCHAQTPTFGSGNCKNITVGWRKKGLKKVKRIWKNGKRITISLGGVTEAASHSECDVP